MPLNRIVALCTPLFTAVAGVVSGYAAKYGFHLDPTQVVAVEALAATSAAGSALKWLHGSQKVEAYAAEAARVEKLIAAELAQAGVKFSPDEVEAKLQALIAQLAADVSGKASAEAAARKAEDDRSAAEQAAGEARTELTTVQAQLANVQAAITPDPQPEQPAPSPASAVVVDAPAGRSPEPPASDVSSTLPSS